MSENHLQASPWHGAPRGRKGITDRIRDDDAVVTYDRLANQVPFRALPIVDHPLIDLRLHDLAPIFEQACHASENKRPSSDRTNPLMRIVSVIIGIAGSACLGLALWLLFRTVAFYLSADYAPNAGISFSYRAGLLEADGSGIFLPTLLLLAVAAFLLKFAFNLWREPSEDSN